MDGRMSDNYLRLVPTDPSLVPTQHVATTCVNIVGAVLPDADEIVAESYGHPVFIDQGANLESIICPSCQTTLSFAPENESIRQWWYEVIDEIGDDNVATLEVRMVCCGALVPFASIQFEWPAAVASFEISILNPNVAQMPTDTIASLETILSCRIKQVWAHY